MFNLSGGLLGAIVVPMLGVSAVGSGLYLIVRWVQGALPPTIWLFGLLGLVAGGVLTAFTWLLFLRPMLGSYVPARFRRYLLVPAEVPA